MRGITVRQPWAWAIVHGGKDVENRTRSLGPYRGPVAIHAGLDDADEAPPSLWLQHADHYRRTHPHRDPDVIHSERGVIIGVVDLVDVHEATPPEVEWCGCSAWAERFYVHHLVLANPRPLARPIPWRGALGLWRVPDELEASIREQVTL